MKGLHIDYGVTGHVIADLTYNNLGRYQKSQEVILLPGLKVEASVRSPSDFGETLSQLCDAIEGDKPAALTAVRRLLAGKHDYDWRIVEVALEAGNLKLRLVDQNGQQEWLTIPGNDFPQYGFMLEFQGQRDSLSLELKPCRTICAYTNDTGNKDIIILDRLNDPTQHCWYLSARREITW